MTEEVRQGYLTGVKDGEALATRKLGEVRKGEIHAAVRQVLYSELFPAAKDGGKGSTGDTATWREWIKREMREAVYRWTRGTDTTTFITDVVREEIRKAVKELNWSRSNDEFNAHVRKIAQAEANTIVTRMIQESFAIDVAITGNVHQPAKGQRALDVSAAEDRSA